MFILINYCYWQWGLYLYQIMLNHNELTVFILSSYTHIKYKNKEANIACHTKLLQHSSSCWSILQKKVSVYKIFKLKKTCLSVCISVGLLISQFLFHLGWQNIIYTYTKVSLYRCRDPTLIPYSCTICCLLLHVYWLQCIIMMICLALIVS